MRESITRGARLGRINRGSTVRDFQQDLILPGNRVYIEDKLISIICKQRPSLLDINKLERGVSKMLNNPFTPTEIAAQPEDFFGRRAEVEILERSLM